MNTLAPRSDALADLCAVADDHGYAVRTFKAGDRWQAILTPKDGGPGFRHASRPQLADALRGALSQLPTEAPHA